MTTKADILSRHGVKTVELTRRRAIREKCMDCSAWRSTEVDRCSFRKCALFPYRTGKGKQDAKARNKAIRTHCTWCMAGDVHEVKRCTSPHCALFSFRGVSRATKQGCPSLSEKAHRQGCSETISPRGIG